MNPFYTTRYESIGLIELACGSHPTIVLVHRSSLGSISDTIKQLVHWTTDPSTSLYDDDQSDCVNYYGILIKRFDIDLILI